MDTNKIEISEQEIDRAMAEFCPFAYLDIKRALEVISEAEKENEHDNLYEICKDFAESCDIKIEDIDPVAQVYDYYHQIARTDIENKTGKDICNDAPYSEVNIAGNYLATLFDKIEEPTNALIALIETIPEDERSNAIKWLLSELK
jgi:hypothetical protein